jgi:hypothetical protein
VTSRVDRARDAVELKRQQVQRAVEAGRVAAAHAREDLERRIAETKAAYQPAGRRPGARWPATAPGRPRAATSSRPTGPTTGWTTGLTGDAV